MNKKAAAAIPDKLAEEGVDALRVFKAAYDAGERNFIFDSKLYGHVTVKSRLLQDQEGKCCFCEAKIDHISYGDVEHFRPKGGWVQNEEPLNTPGYYWLAYEWDNLFLSCQLCNQRHKRNYFPLINPNERALSHHHDLNLESPYFIHPTHENPEDFIEFAEEVPKGRDMGNRGKNTIAALGIDREKLNEQRREKLFPIFDLYKLAKGIPETTPEIKKEAWHTVKKYYAESLLDKTQYASMLRCFFRQNPIPAEFG